MKKFVFGLLSVFIILGGVFLTACGTEVSMSVSTQDIVMYTNDRSKANNEEKEVEVTLENSSSGINVEIIKGNDCITLDKTNTTKPKANGKYAFKILTKANYAHGEAQIFVYPIEDKSKGKYIDVYVNTVLTGIVVANNDNVNAKSDLFVVKGVEKELAPGEYFTFEPITANVIDVDWSFEIGDEKEVVKEYVVDGNVLARIEDSKLYVSEQYNFPKITLRAFSKNSPSANAVIAFDVLNNSTIKTLDVDGNQIYENGALRINDLNIDLKRNNEEVAVAPGVLVVNSEYDFDLDVNAYVRESNGDKKYMSKKEYSKYFNFDILDEKSGTPANTHTYQFILDAYDYLNNGLTGRVNVEFTINYKNYNFSVTTEEATITLREGFSATRVDLLDENGNGINNEIVDIFSSYEGKPGYLIQTIVQPENRAIDNAYVRYVVDLNQDALASKTLDSANPVDDIFTMTYRGRKINFVRSGSLYVSDELASGSEVYVVANGTYENFVLNVQSLSNTNIATDVFMNLYQISTEENLNVTTLAGEEMPDKVYVSSGLSASRSQEFVFKISGISSAIGLSLDKNASENFVFSEYEVLESHDAVDVAEKYVVIRFVVDLASSKFNESASFKFVHLTGKESKSTEIEAFVPLESAYVQNASSSLSDVYYEKYQTMGYAMSDDGVVVDEKKNDSLAKLIVEASANLDVNTLVLNAKLAPAGIKYKYLPYSDFIDAIATYGLEEEAKQIFDDADFDKILTLYPYFTDVTNRSEFSISQTKLKVVDTTFKGVVAVEIHGFDDEHDEEVFVRFFTIESVYSVRYLKTKVEPKTLYTTETLSQADMAMSYVDVVLELRPDDKIPTYSNVYNRLSFDSAATEWDKVEETFLQNKYYMISDVRFAKNGREISFKITANSTNMQTSFHDVLTICYKDVNNIVKSTEIAIEIKNVERIKSVEWLNKPSDGKIYLNLTSASQSEKEFTISTSVLPATAHDIRLIHSYIATSGADSYLNFTTSEVGQTININLNTEVGGNGFLYLLPADMVKTIDGTDVILLYKYEVVDGELVETPVYSVNLSDINSRYNDIVAGCDEFDNYYIGNDGNKVYYENLILKIEIEIADGKSEETAIRVYNQGDLENIDSSLYYEIVNDISFTNWRPISEFKGGIEGNGKTLKFAENENNGNFINKLSGTLSNINFVGFVESYNNVNGGFIADSVEKTGVIENCSIDVYGNEQVYKPSLLKANAQAYVGTIAGKNEGLISNVKVYGLSISSASNWVGGLVGRNTGRLYDCGFELYDFGNGESTSISYNGAPVNKFGGLVGETGSGSVVENSYVYNFSENEIETANGIKAFVSDADNSSFIKCFAYLGSKYDNFDWQTDIFAKMNSLVDVTIKNSYVTYIDSSDHCACIFFDANGENSSHGAIALNFDIWEVHNIDAGVNFGFPYLKEVLPSAIVDLDTLAIRKVEGKSAYAAENKGVLFLYKTIQSLTTDAQRSELESYNTISISELFGITPQQARSLLLTSSSTNVVIDANKIKIVGETFDPFTISVHLKMDYSQTRDFEFVIVNALPTLNATIAGEKYTAGQIVMLQTTKTRNVVYNIESKISLAGTIFALQKDEYNISISESEHDIYVSANKSGNIVVLKGLTAHPDNAVSRIITHLNIADLISDYNDCLRLTEQLNVRVFNGATDVVVEDANSLCVNASRHETFSVYMSSDNADENMLIELEYDGQKIEGISTDSRNVFVVDSKLSLEVIWTKNLIAENRYKFDVVIKILDENRYLIDQNYDNLVLLINAQSQKESSEYLRRVEFAVEPIGIDDVAILPYKISSRIVRANKLYFNKSNETISTLSPSSDAILAVEISPVYANIDYFTLTYTTKNVDANGKETGKVGMVNISRLEHGVNGYYINSESTISIENGVRVNLTDADKNGDGYFYFRIYVSSGFVGEVDLQFAVSVYGQNVETRYKTISVSALIEASVEVKGKEEENWRTNYLLSKGQEADVKVTIGEDQTLYDFFLQNNESGIFLSSPTCEIVNGNKIYSAKLNARVNAKLSDGKDSGVFYVCATVERVINGVQEFRTTTATIYLVDFAINQNPEVASSGKTATYNGKTYDVFTSYINDSQELRFDYTILPENYEYDVSNQEEVALVEALKAKKNKFINDGYYDDANANYYINYEFNDRRGVYEAVDIKKQLWYAKDEEHLTQVYNATYDRMTQSDFFGISENDGKIQITGRRAGTQLMMLRTTIICMGEKHVFDYFFLVKVELYTDEDSPKTIRTAQEFLDVLDGNSGDSAHYILMNDIVLDEYTPRSTDNFESFDGNGYTIHINSFAKPENTNQIRFALFDNVAINSTIKNLKVNLYNGGQIALDINTYTDIVVAGFAISNDGVIYNCEVVSYYDENYQSSKISGDTGIIVSYTNGEGMDAVRLSSQSGVESTIVGFVYENKQSGGDYASIANSRVGGEETSHFVDVDGVSYRQRISLDTFVIQGQGNVSGFVGQNDGYVSASFAKNIQINNQMNSTTSITAGFALTNNNNLQNNYVEGLGEDYRDDAPVPYKDLSSIDAMGIVAGFVCENNGLVKNGCANIAIENALLSAGFVYKNNAGATISLCYSACITESNRVGQMEFSGVDGLANSLNKGKISLSYYYQESRLENYSNESKIGSGAVGIKEVFDQDSFYGFSFNSSNGSYDGIWQMTPTGLELVSANKIALSNRYAKTNGNIESVFYNKTTRDFETYEVIDISYGSVNNPIIIRDADDFAKATGKATAKEISTYKEYYNDTEVFGSYRLVGVVDMSEVAQNEDDNNAIRLTTTSKIFRGILDGNGFVVSNISLGSVDNIESFGLFAKLDSAVIMNLDLTVESVHNTKANVVGTLAGIAYDTRILSVHLSPATNSEQSSHTAVQGTNVVGGVVGMVLGNSYLCDITIENIDVESVYHQNGKEINANKNKILQIRQNINVDLENSITDYVSGISYAGAVAGLVDIYTSDIVEYAKYSDGLTIKDYNVVSVDVSGAVNIYGEIVGGVFGYIGSSTYVYDATIKLGTEKSHIISKNLFAGGIVGENYGALHALLASYDDLTQATIERNANAYYNSSISADMGQQTIFSYAENEEGSFDKINNPLFVGGLVGHMGGGFIYIAYNKLNVVSTKDDTKAVGGIVGLLGKSEAYYTIKFVSPSTDVNYMFRDVYSSGNVYAQNGIAGGIIGSIEQQNGKTSDVLMMNVVALNMISYHVENNVGVLDGGNENHFTLMGKIYNKKDSENVWNMLDENATISSNIYLVDNLLNIAYNIKTREVRTEAGSPTVGGYGKYYTSYNKGNNGAVDGPIQVGAYGFNKQDMELTNKPFIYDDSIGSEALSEMSFAYARNYSYFIGNGWSEKFWVHKQDELLPNIELTPKLEVVFWDAYNKEDVLKMMNNSTITVVVRGRIRDSISDDSCTDIDLTGVNFDAINFKGKLYSYAKYMGTLEGGIVTDSNAKSNVGEGAGIVLDRTLFSMLSNSALVDGVKFFITGNDGKFNGIANTIEDSIVRNVEINICENISLTAQAQGYSENRKNATGVLAQAAVSSSIMNLEIKFKNEGSKITLYGGSADESYLGVLVGYIEQKSKFTNVTIQNINITSETGQTIEVFVNATAGKDAYVGLFAGYARKTSGAKLEISMKEIVKNFKFETLNSSAKNIYLGGYVGKVENADVLIFEKQENPVEGEFGFEFNYTDFSATNLYQGTFVGEINGQTISIAGGDTTIRNVLKGKLSVSEIANIGGLVGFANGADLNISGFRFDIKYGEGSELSIRNNHENAIGGIVGRINSKPLTISNCAEITGKIIASANVVSVGGIVGKSTGGVNLYGDISNKINITLKNIAKANVGGAIGFVSKETASETAISANNSVYTYEADIKTTTGSTASELIVGGFAGFVKGNASIAKAVYGGTFTHNAKNGDKIAVGGIVGEFQGTNGSTIENSFSFADVYVVHGGTDMPAEYFFGGIVGKGNNFAIENCVSMLSNFNARSMWLNGGNVVSNVGAILGAVTTTEAEEEANVTFDGNYYSSGVNLAYQEENGNVDIAYNNAQNNRYVGYNAEKEIAKVRAANVKDGILTKIGTLVDLTEREEGSKLNPIYLNSATLAEGEWYSVSADFETDQIFVEQLTKKKVVGNGHTITRVTHENLSNNGGLFGKIVKNSVVSNLVISIEVEEDVSQKFGGVAGEISGDSIIYAVGVRGTISIGQTSNNTISVGGIVGVMTGGFINECYFDGDLIYRGKENGYIAGAVGDLNAGFNTIANTYTTGLVKPYIKCNSYKFAQASNPSSAQKGFVIDCYSIVELDKSKLVSDSIENIKNVGYFNNNNITAKVYEASSVSALGFDDDSKAVRSFMSATDEENLDANPTYEMWYFDKDVNNGYAAHGFGFLRLGAVSVYEQSEARSTESYVKTYEYTPKLSGDFYKIINNEKYVQMVECKTGNYFLGRDFEYAELNALYKAQNNNDDMKGLSEFDDFELDGNGFKLDGYDSSDAYFDELTSSCIIYNFKMTNAKVTNEQEGEIGILAQKNAGEISNVYVQGQIINNYNYSNTKLGGVVGKNTGTMKFIESVVSVSSTKTAISGGIAGENTGTITYAANNGTITNTATEETLDYDVVLTGKELTSVQGGIVGKNSGTISNSYNANSVMGNFKSATGINTVSGGIVGYATSGSVQNCVNVGMVVSGNYSDETGVSFAGGIVGYAEAVSVSRCVNDGSIQALGKVVPGDPEISITNKSGEDTTDWEWKPDSLEKTFTITYNKGKVRQVYAFGIGYQNGSIGGGNNYNSTDHIKNDGVVGEIVKDADLTFNRNEILDNDKKFANNNNPDFEGDTAFYGKFELLSEGSAISGNYKYSISGKDSYGFVSRVYMIDQITRRYGATGNDLTKVLTEEKPEIRTNNTLTIMQHNGTNVVGVETENHTENDDFSFGYGDETLLYGVGNAVKYSSSTTFVGYEQILKDINDEDHNNLGDYSSTKAIADEKIASINSKYSGLKEAEEVRINGGELAATVYNADQLNSALAPYIAKPSATFTGVPTDARNVNYDVSCTDPWAIKIEDAEIVADDGATRTKSYKLYYPEQKSDLSFNISISYEIERQTDTICLDNIDNGVVYDVERKIDKTIVDSINRTQSENEEYDTRYYSLKSAKIDGVDVTGNFDWDNEFNWATFEITGGVDVSTSLNGKSIEFEFDWHMKTMQKKEITFDVTQTSSTSAAEILSGKITKTYPAAENVFVASESDLKNAWTNGGVNLSAILTKLGNPTKLVLGRTVQGELNYSVAYQNSTWSVVRGSGLNISGNTLTGLTQEAYEASVIYYSKAPTPQIGQSIAIDDVSLGGGFVALFDNVVLASYEDKSDGSSVTYFGVQFEEKIYEYTISTSSGTMIITYNGTDTKAYTLKVNNKTYQNVVVGGTATTQVYNGELPSGEGNFNLKYVTTSAAILGATSSITSLGDDYVFETYTPTADTSVVSVDGRKKTYYNHVGGEFVKVSNPSGNPKNQGWYEQVSYKVSRRTDSDTDLFYYEPFASEAGTSYTYCNLGTYYYDTGYRKILKYSSDRIDCYFSNADGTQIYKKSFDSEGNLLQDWTIETSLSYEAIFGDATFVKLVNRDVGQDIFFISLTKSFVSKQTLTNSAIVDQTNGTQSSSVMIRYEQKSSYVVDLDHFEKDKIDDNDYNKDRLTYDNQTGTFTLKNDIYENYIPNRFTFIASCKETKPIVGSASGDANKKAKYIIFGDNIRGYSVSVGSDQSVFGNGHMLKVSSGDTPILAGTNGVVKDITAVGILSLSDTLTGNQKSLLVGSSGDYSKVSNVKVYGSMRNALYSGQTIKTIGIEFNSDSNKRITAEEIKESNISVNVVDAHAGSVTTTITEDFAGQNIFVSGDGKNGLNGNDGKILIDGQSGGAGGVVTIATSSTSYARNGANGKNGYGGNGENGKYANGKIKTGVAGGNATKNEHASNGINSRTINIENYKGNSGIDGFGRIYKSTNMMYYLDGTTTKTMTWCTSVAGSYWIFGSEKASDWTEFCTKTYGHVDISEWSLWSLLYLGPYAFIAIGTAREYRYEVENLKEAFKSAYTDAGESGNVYYQTRESMGYWGEENDYRNVLFKEFNYVNNSTNFTKSVAV